MTKVPEKMLLKMPAGWLARIDAARGTVNRSAWVRGCIEGELSGGGRPTDLAAEPDAPVVENEQDVPAAGVSATSKTLLGLIRDRRMTSRQAMEAMGITEGLYRKIESELFDADLICVSDGVLEEM